TGGTFDAAGKVTISDKVTLSGVSPKATGSILVEAFGPQTGTPYVCSDANKVGSTTLALSGSDVNHDYSASFDTVTKAGNYVFATSYAGDPVHNTPAVTSGC